MGKAVWNDETIKKLALKNTRSKYLGHEVEYKQSSKRKRKRIFINMLCGNCETEYRTNIDTIKRGGSKWCRKCVHQEMVDKHKKHDANTVVKLFKEKGLKLISEEYEGNSTPLTAINSEGYKVTISYNNLLKGHEPMPFIRYNPYSIENIKLFIEKNACGYKVLSEKYVKADGERLKFECDEGHIYNATWNDFRNGHRCPVCNESKGERAIREFLDDKNIAYIQQHRFDDCRREYTLPFDFYLPEYRVCVEYDGEQHYRPIGYFGGETEFDKTKINDEIKNNYCMNNGIMLIRVPYYVEDIDKHLSEYLEQKGRKVQEV